MRRKSGEPHDKVLITTVQYSTLSEKLAEGGYNRAGLSRIINNMVLACCVFVGYDPGLVVSLHFLSLGLGRELPQSLPKKETASCPTLLKH